MSDLLSKLERETVVFVAHGGLLQISIGIALGIPPALYWKFSLSPASISEVAAYPAGAILNHLNAVSRLDNSQ